MMKRIRLLTLGLIAAGALALSGCEKAADDPASVEDTAVAVEETVEEPDAEEVAEEPAEEIAEPEPAEETEEPEPVQEDTPANLDNIASCLLGSWTADNEFFVAQLEEIGDEAASVSGDVTVTFKPDGQMITDYNDWSVQMVAEGMEVTISRSGTDISEYSVDGNVITIIDVEMSSEMVMDVGGMVMEVDPIPLEHESVAVECDANSAMVAVDGGDMRMTR